MMKLINLTSLGGALHRKNCTRASPQSRPLDAGGAPPCPSPEETQGGTENTLKIWGRGMSVPREVLLVFSSERLSKYIKCDTKSYIIHFFLVFLHQKLTLEL